MTQPNAPLESTPRKRATELAAARKSGGNEKQSHLMGRLKTVMKGRAAADKKTVSR